MGLRMLLLHTAITALVCTHVNDSEIETVHNSSLNNLHRAKLKKMLTTTSFTTLQYIIVVICRPLCVDDTLQRSIPDNGLIGMSESRQLIRGDPQRAFLYLNNFSARLAYKSK